MRRHSGSLTDDQIDETNVLSPVLGPEIVSKYFNFLYRKGQLSNANTGPGG